MDSVELLRSHYDDQREPDAARMEAMRRRLHARIDAEPARRRTQPVVTRRRALTALGVGAAVLVGGTIVAVGAPGAQPASASELLQRAARHAAGSSLTTPGSVVQIRQRYFETTGAGNGLGAPLVVATRETVTLLKLPEDGQLWERKRWETRYDYAYGDRSKMPANMAVRDPNGTWDAAYERSKIGDFAFGTAPLPSDTPIADSYNLIRGLPLDADALLRRLKTDGSGPGQGSAQQVLISASNILDRGVASSQLQNTVFQALQKVPDLAILDQHAVDLDGRTGVAVGVKARVPDPTNSGISLQLIIDPATGQYLGTRAVSTRKDGLIPAGTQTWADAVTPDVKTTTADWTPPAGNRWLVYP